MKNRLGKSPINTLLWELSIPAILGMLSSAIYNIVDRFFVGKIEPLALSGVGITMPIQMLQMAIILLIGVGSSTLVSIRLGENEVDEAESIIFIALKYIVISMFAFALAYLIFENHIFNLLSISNEVRLYARPYIRIIIVGSIIGIPGYCLNNSLRAIGKAKVTMQAILFSSILNIILDPIFIFGLKWGIGGAAIATVLSQTVLTVYIIFYFVHSNNIEIHLKIKKVANEWGILKQIFINGSPSFNVQIFASLLNVYVNRSFVKYGTDLDVAAITIIATIFSFYNMIVFGIVQGNQPIVGYNWGAKNYKRVRESLTLSIAYSFALSIGLFLMIQWKPALLVSIFTEDNTLKEIATRGIRIYLLMLPFVGPQVISSQYFQSVGKPRVSSILLFFRYGIITVPTILLLAPRMGVSGIYLSNAISDGIASLVAFAYIIVEIRWLIQLERLSTLEKENSLDG